MRDYTISVDVLKVWAVFTVFLFSGCRYYSWFVFENPEFPDNAPPVSLSNELKEKYTVGDVVVKPRFVFSDGSQTNQKLFVLFFSKSPIPEVSIENLEIRCNGTLLEFGKKFFDSEPSAWEMYPINSPFYVRSIGSQVLPYSVENMVKGNVGVSMQVTVIENGLVTQKQITAEFLPQKKSYIE